MASVKTVEQLPCKLDAEELLLKSRQMVELMVERTKLEDQKKLEAAALKSQIDSLGDRISALGKDIHRGEEDRPIECIERPRYELMRVDIVRTDLGTVVRQRPMHPTERQTALDIGEVSAVTPIGSARSKKKPKSDEEEGPTSTH
jgi:hypothetical protein